MSERLDTTIQCPNCGHIDHHGERCRDMAGNDFCACSWPDPDNFTDAQ